jgi:hypothetical protein
MKNRLCNMTAGSVAFFTVSVFAQVGASFGITGGFSTFWETASSNGETVSSPNKTGLVVGGLLDISLVNLLSIEPGLAYSMRGYKKEDHYGSVSDNFSYLAVPIHAKVKYTLPTLPEVKPYALAGLNFGFLLSAKFKEETTGYPTYEADEKSSMNAVDMGFDLGAGVEFSLPTITPFVEFVCYLGMTDFPKDMAPGESLKNNGTELKAGVKFKL